MVSTRVVESHSAERRPFYVVYFRRLRGGGESGPPWLNASWSVVPPALFVFFTMMVLAIIDGLALRLLSVELIAFIPSMGAAAGLVFSQPALPGAQPRVVVCSHVVGAAIGLSLAHAMSSVDTLLRRQLSSAFAVAILTGLMALFGTTHPAASATTVFGAFHELSGVGDRGFLFLVAPALFSSSVIVILGWLLINIAPQNPSYPVWW